MTPRFFCLAITLALVALCILSAGCTGTGPANNDTAPAALTPIAGNTTGNTSVPAESSLAVAAGNNRFAADLSTQLDKDPANAGKNIFFSPYSISSALAIVDEGAQGKTAGEIRAVFSFPENVTVQREGFSGIDAGLNAQDSRYSLSTANALWAEKTYPFLPAYTDTAERYYGANTTNLDFVGQPEASRSTINQWVEQKTNDKIQDLLPPGSIDSSTRLVITNAIYFKGTWVREFDKNNTAPADFSVTPTKTVQVPMMQRTDRNAIYPYAETSSVQLLEMPYAHGSGNELAMVVILPKDNNLTAAAELLDPQVRAAVENTTVSRQVKVYIPRFTLETEYDLTGTLATMGMPTAFSGNADFSGMDGSGNLSISSVVHKAYIDVNEEGTEAAAATGVVMVESAIGGPTPVFDANHPFLFLIEDKETGTVLFAGRVVNPEG